MKKVMIGMGLLASLTCVSAHAGKVEEVQKVVKESCGKDVASADALRLVKQLFLSCTPGQKSDVDGCMVTCLKGNSGAVVGQ